MDWVIVFIVIGFVVLTGARTAISIWFPASWIDTALKEIAEATAWGDDCGSGDGGD